MPRELPYVWFWRKWLGDRKGQRCRVLIRSTGKIRNILVEFADGFLVVAPMWAVRRAGPPTRSSGRRRSDERLR